MRNKGTNSKNIETAFISSTPVFGGMDTANSYPVFDNINKRIIKFVGDPYERINEDPCRILRACRFLAKINGTFDIDTAQALNIAVVSYERLKKVAPERIRSEILKAMKIFGWTALISGFSIVIWIIYAMIFAYQ